MTYNTGNPIGSTDARDRLDNSENLDLAVNSLSPTFVDRLGVTRDTLEGIYQKSAYYRAGTFDAGYTLTNNRQTLAYGNIEYSWSGSFPKVVAAGSTPATSGGIGVGAWVDRTDGSLRAEITPSVTEALRRSYADAGYNLVDGSFESGGTLTNTNDVLVHKASGIAYSWGGTLPITVVPNSTLTPIGSGGWVDRSAVTLRSDVTAHEAKAGAHAISGVSGLQAALDSKEASGTASSLVTPLADRVTALEALKFTTLIPATYPSGAPRDTRETVVAELPASITSNSVYTLPNPFGVNVRVICEVEIWVNDRWAPPGWDGNSGTVNGTAFGTDASYVQGVGIVVQTGAQGVGGASNHLGGGFAFGTWDITSAPCRIAVRKWEA